MKNKEQITEIPNFLGRAESAALLKNLFDRRQIWEARKERRVSYRNGDWYTLGSSLYLDLKSEQQYGEYVEKSLYWQSMLNDPTIKPFLDEIRLRLEKNVLGKKTFFLADRHFRAFIFFRATKQLRLSLVVSTKIANMNRFFKYL